MKKIALIITLIIIIIMVGSQSTNALTPTSTLILTTKATPYLKSTPIPSKQTQTPEPSVPNPTPSKSLRNEDGNISKKAQGGILRQIDGGIRYINEHACYSLDIPKYWRDYFLVREDDKFGIYSFYFYGESKIGQGYKMYEKYNYLVPLFTIATKPNLKFNCFNNIGDKVGNIGDLDYFVAYSDEKPLEIINKELEYASKTNSYLENNNEEKAKIDSDKEIVAKMSMDIDEVLMTFNEVTRQDMGWSYICVDNLIDSLRSEYSNFEITIDDAIYASKNMCYSDDNLNYRLRVDIKDLNRIIDKMTLNVFNDNGDIVETKTYKNVLIYLQDDKKMFDELDKDAFDSQFLWVSGCKKDSDISEIARFKHLRQLYIEECEDIYDISAIGKLTRLKELSLGGTYLNSYIEFESIEPLANLTRLEKLNLAYVSLPDISPLANIKNLEILDFTMAYNLKDISYLSELINLEELYMQETQIEDISSLRYLNNLNRLSFTCTGVDDISTLANLKNLKYLNMFDTYVCDITPISNITSLEMLYLGFTDVKDITLLNDLINLKRLDISYLPIRDISSFSKLTNLEYLNLSDTHISDLSVLKEMSKLKELYLLDCKLNDSWEQYIPEGCKVYK